MPSHFCGSSARQLAQDKTTALHDIVKHLLATMNATSVTPIAKSHGASQSRKATLNHTATTSGIKFVNAVAVNGEKEDLVLVQHELQV